MTHDPLIYANLSFIQPVPFSGVRITHGGHRHPRPSVRRRLGFGGFANCVAPPELAMSLTSSPISASL
jgi:hypothetical protein